jgi:hypothetical protein
MFSSPRAISADNPVKKERRSWNRIPVQIVVFCQNVQDEDELCWSARVADISRGGIRLLSPHKFEPAAVIRIGRAEGCEGSLQLVEALVVRAERPPGQKWTLGCAFTKELSEPELLAWIDETADSGNGRQDSPML